MYLAVEDVHVLLGSHCAAQRQIGHRGLITKPSEIERKLLMKALQSICIITRSTTHATAIERTEAVSTRSMEHQQHGSIAMAELFALMLFHALARAR